MSRVGGPPGGPGGPARQGSPEIQQASPRAAQPQRTQGTLVARQQSAGAGSAGASTSASLPPRGARLQAPAQAAQADAATEGVLRRTAVDPTANNPPARVSLAPVATFNPLFNPASSTSASAVTRPQAQQVPEAHTASPRANLQQALEKLDASSNRQSQAAAHKAAVAYADNPGSFAGHFKPVLHKALQLSVGGTMPTFGVGLNAGTGLADMAGAAVAGHDLHQQAGWNPGTPAVPLPASPALAVAEWIGGSATGAVGNMLGQKYLKPLTDRMDVEYAAIDSKALLTDEMKAAMNSLKPGADGKPGWGDQMEQEIKHKQGSLTAISSPANVNIGRAWFAAATAVRVAAQAGAPEGFARTVVAGAAVSTLAGMAIGGTMAARAGHASVALPKEDKLLAMRRAQADGQPVDPQNLSTQANTQTMRLFYPKAKEGAAAAQATAPGAAATSGNPQPSALQHAEINTASWANRAWLLGSATVGKTLAAAAGPALGSLTPNKGLEVAVRAAVASAGICSAIQPWFKAVGGEIKAFDDGRKAAIDDRNKNRLGQEAVRPGAQQAAPQAGAVAIEMQPRRPSAQPQSGA